MAAAIRGKRVGQSLRGLLQRLGQAVYWCVWGALLLSATLAMLQRSLGAEDVAGLALRWYLYASLFLVVAECVGGRGLFPAGEAASVPPTRSARPAWLLRLMVAGLGMSLWLLLDVIGAGVGGPPPALPPWPVVGLLTTGLCLLLLQVLSARAGGGKEA